jgi:hypothetical protein
MPEEGSAIPAIASSRGCSDSAISPVVSASSSAVLRRSEQRTQVRANHISPSVPQLLQTKQVVMPAQSRQIGWPSRSTPGNGRSVEQPGQRPRCRTPRRAQLMQTYPSGQW